jgi:hypothetical protein
LKPVGRSLDGQYHASPRAEGKESDNHQVLGSWTFDGSLAGDTGWGDKGWIDLGTDVHDHFVVPEQRLNLAMARQ